MIDLAATAALIQNLKNKGFTSAREKLIAIVLANVSQIQQCEIIEILDLSDPHCRSTLKEFVEKKLLESFGKRDIFYRPTGLLELPARTAQPPAGTAQPPTGRVQPPTGKVQPPAGRVQPPPSLSASTCLFFPSEFLCGW